MAESKADIKNRMLKSASAAWGLADKANENAFDPLVSLLLEVYASELEKTSHEIDRSRERILQKMVQLMAPDVLTAAMPAHAVMHCQSFSERILLKDKEQFYIPGQYDTHRKQDTWFSPAGDYYITDAVVKYQAAGSKLYRYSSPNSRETVATASAQSRLQSIWLGLSGASHAWQKAQFCFEFNDENRKSSFYHHLAHARWYIDDHLIHSAPGFNSPVKQETLPERLQTQSISRKMTRLVHELYKNFFVSTGTNENIRLQGQLPDIVKQAFATQSSAIAQENIIWIRIEFPENISPALLEEVVCQVNCVPVINRQLHELSYRLQNWINIIPLNSEEQFFDLHDVINQQGQSLLQPANKDDKTLQLLLRKGGANRFDERDARAVIEHLLQLLRNETASFSRYGRDFISDEVKHIQQTINRLSQQLAKTETSSDPVPYLEIDCGETIPHQHLFIEYWSTQGAAANSIKAGTALMAYRNGAIRQNSLTLMTTTHGGRNHLQPHESIPVYKSAVLSKDRIMSSEDIRLFCLRETGPIAAAVEVKKGVMIGEGRSKGYTKTIDVFIDIHKNAYIQMLESNTMEQWKHRLQLQLSERSMAFMPFRVFFKAA